MTYPNKYARVENHGSSSSLFTIVYIEYHQWLAEKSTFLSANVILLPIIASRQMCNPNREKPAGKPREKIPAINDWLDYTTTAMDHDSLHS